MPWARIDDGIYDHPKVTELLDEPEGWAAFGFWTACLAWAHKHTRKPGKIPGYLSRRDVHRMDRSVGIRYAELLCKVNLWVPAEGGWQIHDFDQYLPKTATSAARAEAGRRGGIRSGQVRATKAEKGSTELPDGSTELQNPSKPEASGEASGEANAGSGKGSSKSEGSREVTVRESRAKRATRIPPDFTVTPEMVAWKAKSAPKVDGRRETEKFINYWSAKSGSDATKLDWVATWRNWILRAAERPSPDGKGTLDGLWEDR